jgi:short-subunit dehydrogenase
MHVAITGASSGIGEALAREFSSVGASVTLIARRKDLLERIAGSLKGPSYLEAVDLLNSERVCSWLPNAEKMLGPVDVLINNAGMQIVSPLEETDPSQGEALLTLNLMVPLRLTRAVLPGMLARRQGTIVDISSMAAVGLTPGMYYYNAAKAGLAAASEGLRTELRGTGVHVVTVYPGPVHSAMAIASFEKYGMDPGKIPTGTPEALARLIHLAVRKRKPRVIYPSFYLLGQKFPGVARFCTGRFTPRLSKGK